jgi:thiamine biosynthesis lipoprotein
MGGQVAVHIACADASAARAERAATRVGARIEAWAARLTRFTTTSDLAALNADPWQTQSRVPPTLAAVLSWAEAAADHSEGVVDVTLLDARLAAEHPATSAADVGLPVTRRWWLQRASRGGIVHRSAGVRFDLDGVAKGWIADRALAMLGAWPGALVDGDGDVAVGIGPGVEWHIGVDDPRGAEARGAEASGSAADTPLLGTLRFSGDGGSARTTLGVATSGTSVHRWRSGDDVAHHLIDPTTGLPARTDVVQATVIAGSARVAETLAKSVVILGSDAGLSLLERARARGGIVVLESGDVIALPQTLEWLA